MRPFSCGTQYMDWEEFNCCHCAKYPADEAWKTEQGRAGICPIMLALSEACIGDGQITDEIAARMGYTPSAYNWRCPEFVPDGTQQERQDNSAQTLKSAIITAFKEA